MQVLRYFEWEGDKRVPVILELDNSMTMVRRYVDRTMLDHVESGRRPRSKTNEVAHSHSASLTARWLALSIKENPIPGTDALREAYESDLDALFAKHREAGTECRGCDIAKVHQKYRAILTEKGLLNDIK